MRPRRDLMILVAAVGVSAGGDIGAIAALAVHVQESTHSGLAVAGLFLANWLALALAAPAGGAIVDRAEARGLLIAASAFQAVVAAALASTPGLPGVLALCVLLGVGGAIAVPAEFALVGAVAARAPGPSGRTPAWRRRGTWATCWVLWRERVWSRCGASARRWRSTPPPSSPSGLGRRCSRPVGRAARAPAGSAPVPVMGSAC